MRSTQGRQGATGYDAPGANGLQRASERREDERSASVYVQYGKYKVGTSGVKRRPPRLGISGGGALRSCSCERLPSVPSSRPPLAARASPVFGPCLILPKTAIR
jgi:hypothetical protein